MPDKPGLEESMGRMDPQEIQSLIDRARIKELIIRFANALDLQHWDMLRSCFEDEIEVDYSDFRGESPRRVSADDFVGKRRSGLTGIKTQHLSFNHDITLGNDYATCLSSSVILRVDPAMKGENFFNTHCQYEHTLVRTTLGWKISKIRQIVLWNRGNPRVHGFHRDQKRNRKGEGCSLSRPYVWIPGFLATGLFILWIWESRAFDREKSGPPRKI